MTLTLTCPHGTRSVEFTPGGIGCGTDEYTMRLLFVMQPRCPYCDPMDSESTMEGPSIEKRVRSSHA